MPHSQGNPASRPARPAGDPGLRNLLDHLTEVVFETDVEGVCTYVNAAWTRLMGVPAEAAIGRDLSSFVHEDDRDLHRSRFGAVLEGRRATLHYEIRFTGEDAAELWIELSAHAESADDGSVTGVVGTLADITARRAMEDELRELAYAAEEARADAESAAQLLRAEVDELTRERDQATAAARASAEFVASMAHDLRTPLNGVLGMTEMLLHGELDDDQRDQANTVRSSAESLVRLISDIVEFSRAGAGNLAVANEDFDLRLVVEDVSKLLAQKAMAKGVAFNATLAPTVPDRLRGDAAHLRGVLTNLASNAVRFTDEGSVSLVVSRGRSAVGDGRVPVRIEIHDTDRALSTEALAEMLEQKSGTGSSQRTSGSAGLGLAISRRLVELMGGSIFVGGEPGHGCVIEIEIPFQRAATAPPMVREPSFSLSAEPLDMTVLVAEDNPVNQKVAARLLAGWGVRVSVVSDGQAAVDALEDRRYDLVLMDVLMPRMNGLQATGEIRKREEGRDKRTPIVAMTAHGLSGDRERCLEAGMDGFVAKPIQTRELYVELSKWAKPGSSGGEVAAAA